MLQQPGIQLQLMVCELAKTAFYERNQQQLQFQQPAFAAPAQLTTSCLCIHGFDPNPFGSNIQPMRQNLPHRDALPI